MTVIRHAQRQHSTKRVNAVNSPAILPSVVVPSDAYFKYTSLLLPGTGTNNATNNTFLDSSTNNFTITRNGNTSQGTFSPYGSNWSNYFDGVGDYLITPTNSAFDFGTGDFTIEFWVYLTNSSATTQTIMGVDLSASTNSIQVWYNNTANKITFNVYGYPTFVSSSTVSVNNWIHLAFTRSSGTFKMFINGAQEASGALTNNLANNVFVIGRGYASISAEYFYGYVSNLRVVKGTAVYTSSFTPSTTPLTAITNTSLLTCQSNRFIDNSTNALAITKFGDTTIQRFSPFSPSATYSTSTIGGSGYFDGTGDYLSFTGGSATQLTADFTIEAWVYFNSFSVDASILSIGKYNINGGIFYVNTSGKLSLYRNTTLLYTSSGSLSLNTWSHIVYVRQGTTLTGYINGVSQGSITFTDTVEESGGVGTYISEGYATAGLAGHFINGYLSNLRLVKGTAVYTSTFTPPTAPVTAITNTSLLLNYTNAGIIDNAMMNNLETVGNAAISTSVVKYGTGSMYFDGTNSVLSSSSNNIYNFGTGDFTIEMWVNRSGAGTGDRFLISRSNGADFLLRWNASGILQFYIASTLIASYTWAFTTGTWYHLAVVRNGSGVTIYINGTSVGTGTNSTNMSSTANVMIGGYIITLSDYFNGYIDDLRITKGYARYTSNFTAPTAALETQ
jgi:hypothetical protein